MSLTRPDPVKTLIYVCVTCRPASPGAHAHEERPGARLHAALAALAESQSDLDVRPVECLSVCKRPCTIGFAGAGKWTYVYGDLDAADAELVLAGARLYAESPQGLIPWRRRPQALKTGVVARIPPSPLALEDQEAAE